MNAAITALGRRSPIAPSSGCVRTSIASPPSGRSSRQLRLYRAQGHALLEEFRRLCFTPQLPSGQARGNHWGPHSRSSRTSSQTAYYFNAHTRDLGNFTVVGPSGSGKTVFLSFLSAQAQRIIPRPKNCSSSTRIGVPRSSSAPWAGNMKCSHPGNPRASIRSLCRTMAKTASSVPALRLHAEASR